MKHRFYGDQNDYIKYGLLNVLSSQYESIGINWYLTDDHHGKQNHGKLIGYLNDDKWRYYNPRIFHLLKHRVENNQRNVQYCRIDHVVEIKEECIEQLPDNKGQIEYANLRADWHAEAKKKLAECDLVFFDPDIGVIEQLPAGPIRASEYATIAEINDYNWCDWVAIQFLERRRRFDQMWCNPITASAQRMNKKVVAFVSSTIAFLYVTDHIDATLSRKVFERWDTRICTQILIV